MSPFTSLSYLASRSFTLTLSPHSGSPVTAMGSARQRCTICGYDTHAGVGISTLSLGPNSEKQALKIDCLEPLLMMIWSGLMARPPDMSERLRATAARSSTMPGFAA